MGTSTGAALNKKPANRIDRRKHRKPRKLDEKKVLELREQGLPVPPQISAKGASPDAALATVGLADRDDAIESNDRSVGVAQQLVVPLDDLHPIGLLDQRRVGVQRGDRRLGLELAETVSSERPLQELDRFGDQPTRHSDHAFLHQLLEPIERGDGAVRGPRGARTRGPGGGVAACARGGEGPRRRHRLAPLAVGRVDGLLVAVPTVLLVVLIAHRRRDERSHREQPPTPTQTHIVERQIVVLVPAGARRWQQLDAIMLATGATRHTAERYLLTGAVKVVES